MGYFVSGLWSPTYWLTMGTKLCPCGLICTGNCTPEAKLTRALLGTRPSLRYAGYHVPYVDPARWAEYPKGSPQAKAASGMRIEQLAKALGLKTFHKPKQTDVPRWLRRAKGALDRARGLEDMASWYESHNYPGMAKDRADRALPEYARAACHALQWLLT